MHLVRKYKSRQHFTEEMLQKMLDERRCKECQFPSCCRCGNPLGDVWHRGHGEPLCSDCRGLVQCAACKDFKREKEFPTSTKKQQRNKWKRKDCLQPSDCRELVPCASCKDLKRENEFPAVTKKQQRNRWKCKDCLQPPCAKCGARRRTPFEAGRRPDAPYYCSKHQP